MAKRGSSKTKRKARGQRYISIDAHPALADYHAYFSKYPSRRASEGGEKLLKFTLARVSPQNSAQRAFNDLLMAGMFESDRGCVLVAAAVIDKQLELLLRELFAVRSAAKPSEIEFFLTAQPLPPLQSTGLKIRLAFVLGLIDRPLMQALAQLQSLRSRVMAHSCEIEWLTPEHSIAICDHLTPKNRKSFRWVLLPETRRTFKRGNILRKPRGVFIVAVMLLSSLLERARKASNHGWGSSRASRRAAQANNAKRVSRDSDGHKSRNGSGK